VSTLESLLRAQWDPWVLPLALACEWWALWFALGRNFQKTAGLVLLANAVSLGAAWGLEASGGLGIGGETTWLAWAASAAAVLLANFGLETQVLGFAMRLGRPSWRWNPYDLCVVLAANVFALALAGGRLALAAR